MSVVIEKGVPIPPPAGGKTGLRAILEKLEVGDSFLWPKEKRTGLFNYFRMEQGKKFTSRTVSESEVRVWRVK
jgi:hypothetical protein